MASLRAKFLVLRACWRSSRRARSSGGASAAGLGPRARTESRRVQVARALAAWGGVRFFSARRRFWVVIQSKMTAQAPEMFRSWSRDCSKAWRVCWSGVGEGAGAVVGDW